MRSPFFSGAAARSASTTRCLSLCLLAAGCASTPGASPAPSSPWNANYAGDTEGNLTVSGECTIAPASDTSISTVILEFSPAASGRENLTIAINTLPSSTTGPLCELQLTGAAVVTGTAAVLSTPMTGKPGADATPACQATQLTLTGAQFTPSSDGSTMDVELQGNFGFSGSPCPVTVSGTFVYWTGALAET